MLNVLPVMLTRRGGLDRAFDMELRKARMLMSGLLPKSSRLRKGSEVDPVGWFEAFLRSDQDRTAAFRAWNLRHHDIARGQDKGGPANRGGLMSEDLGRLLARGSPGALLSWGFRRNLEGRLIEDPARTFFFGGMDEGALRAVCDDLLPAWARDVQVARSVPLVRACAGGLFALDALNADAHLDVDGAALFVWAVAGFLEDASLVKRALTRWPVLRGGFEASEAFDVWLSDLRNEGDVGRVQMPALLAALGMIHRCSVNTSALAPGLLDVGNAALCERNASASVTSVMWMWREASGLVAHIESSLRRTLRQKVLDRFDAMQSSLENLRLGGSFGVRLEQHRRVLVGGVDACLEDDALAEISIAWSQWIEQVCGLADAISTGEAGNAALKEDIRRYSEDPLNHCGRIQDALKRMEETASVLKVRAKELDALLDSAPCPPVQQEMQESPEDPGEEEDVSARIEQMQHDLRVERDRVAAQKDKLRTAGARIAELEVQLESESQGDGALRSIDEVLRQCGEPDVLRARDALAIGVAMRPSLRVLRSAWDSADAMKDFRHGRKLLDLLLRLGGEYIDLLRGGKPDAQARLVFAQDVYKANESEGVKNCEDCVRQRTFEVDGRQVYMDRHLGIGNSPDRRDTLRVYFEVIDGEVVIGHCGEHLASTKKV